jgi:peptidoglycan/xylan/chitin deacetylase (PgdA/CDA1 family)
MVRIEHMNKVKRLSVLSFVVMVCFSEIIAQSTLEQKRFVAITFDDLPVVCRCEDDSSRQQITDKLLATFMKYRMPVLGVVNEQKLETSGMIDPLKVALLQKWLEAGYELGNHGYAHQNINDIPMETYQQEILLGERVTRPLAASKGMPYRFFRHPYLSAGDSLGVRKKLDEFLQEHGYRIAPNTITYQDYTFSGAYETALRRGDTTLAEKIRDAYLPYTLSRWEAAEQQSRDLFGREIKQILMVHANLINADAFDKVAKMMQDRGYTFISIDEALSDPAYDRPDTYNGKVGVTWLTRWAAEMSKRKTYGSTQVPQFVLDVVRK